MKNSNGNWWNTIHFLMEYYLFDVMSGIHSVLELSRFTDKIDAKPVDECNM